MQQPGFAPQQYPPPPPGYPPQQYVQQQPVMLQQGFPPQSSGKVDGVLFLVGWWLTHGFGLGGAGCKNTCLMMTYAVFAILCAIGAFIWGCICAVAAWAMSVMVDLAKDGFWKYISEHKSEISARDMETIISLCGTSDSCLERHFRSAQLLLTIIALLLFIICPLFATSAGFFLSARKEVKALEFQAAYGGQPPVYSGSQTMRTA